MWWEALLFFWISDFYSLFLEWFYGCGVIFCYGKWEKMYMCFCKILGLGVKSLELIYYKGEIKKC